MANPFFFSTLTALVRAHRRMGEEALRAAALVVQNQARMNVRGGFKSGAFVTGGLVQSIDHEVTGGFRPRARVGTVRDYGAFWELGHFNIFTRQYEREPWLWPAVMSTRKAQARAAREAIEHLSTSSSSLFMRALTRSLIT